MTPWNEWQARCAIGLCSAETRAALETFGGKRFRTLAQRGLSAINVSDIAAVAVSDADAWHLLETHLTLPDAANGKAYKQWLFARTGRSNDPPFDVVQGGATLLMRWVVREHLRREYLPADHVSLNQPPPAVTDSDLLTDDWLPGTQDTRDTVERRELQAIAVQQADVLFADMPMRLRAALAARYHRVPLSSPPLLTFLGCGRSAVYTAFREFASGVFDRMRDQYPGDDTATVRDVAIEVFDTLTQRCAAWARDNAACEDMLQRCSNASGPAEASA